MTSAPTSKQLGLIAGRGELAAIAARHLREQGFVVVAVGFDTETATSLTGLVDRFHLLRIGQLEKLISNFRDNGIYSVLMIGKIHKTNMYRHILPDRRALRLLKKMRDRRDDTILKALVEELSREEIAVESIDRYLGHLFAPAGKISRRSPDRRERADIEFGWSLAKDIARLDLGQTVVVKNKAPVAVEAIEGTDQTILRGGALAGPGTVVVKVSKPQQDFRFDVPVVGLETARSLVAAGTSALAVEAGKTLFVQQEEALPLLQKHRIAVRGYLNSDFPAKSSHAGT